MGEVVTGSLPAVVAGTPITQELFVVPPDVPEYMLGKINVVSPTTVAAQGATNFVSLIFEQERAGAVVNTLGTLNVGTTGLTADVPVVVPSSIATDASILQGNDVIRVRAAHTGTGGALPVGVEVNVDVAD